MAQKNPFIVTESLRFPAKADMPALRPFASMYFPVISPLFSHTKPETVYTQHSSKNIQEGGKNHTMKSK